MCLFCDFVNGSRKFHFDDKPFLVLNETEHTLCFLSKDFPEKEDSHVLVIPKKHFASLEDVPVEVLHDLIEHVKLVSKILKKTHQGCNILLNNGSASGQYIMHVHFHVIPRNEGDDIKIEVWKDKKITKSEFLKIHKRLKKEFD